MKKTEICTHCGVDYIPKRRGAQKFCSNSCRSRYWQLKQPKITVTKVTEKQKNELGEVVNVPDENAMTLGGVKNTLTGNALYDLGKSALTPEHKKPARRQDIDELKALIMGQRYFPVNNADKNMFNQSPFYDIETGNVVYI
ncbi:hypothetical protein V8G69_14880 [Gaetbulibacter sp. M235]|uniref:hypothetical protein n=1 Tax=Gaetbulibacter sp. M235 TaxID=3126510 RepID=UPI00374E2E37